MMWTVLSRRSERKKAVLWRTVVEVKYCQSSTRKRKGKNHLTTAFMLTSPLSKWAPRPASQSFLVNVSIFAGCAYRPRYGTLLRYDAQPSEQLYNSGSTEVNISNSLRQAAGHTRGQQPLTSLSVMENHGTVLMVLDQGVHTFQKRLRFVSAQFRSAEEWRFGSGRKEVVSNAFQ
jgi:hypothetical protein